MLAVYINPYGPFIFTGPFIKSQTQFKGLRLAYRRVRQHDIIAAHTVGLIRNIQMTVAYHKGKPCPRVTVSPDSEVVCGIVSEFPSKGRFIQCGD